MLLGVAAAESSGIDRAKDAALKLGSKYLGLWTERTLAHARGQGDAVISAGNNTSGWILMAGAGKLSARALRGDGSGRLAASVFVDWDGARMDYRRRFGKTRRSPLARAVGGAASKLGGLQVLDATAGLGVDGFTLASLGAHVTMVERSPIMHLLLQDGLARALVSQDPDVVSAASRLRLIHGDSFDYLSREGMDSEVVFLDPMFPAPPRKESAARQAGMVLARQVVGPDLDSEQLLSSCLAARPPRLVLKRPRQYPAPLDYTLRFASTQMAYYVWINK